MDILDPKKDSGVFLVDTQGGTSYLFACTARVSGLVVVGSPVRGINGRMVFGRCNDHDYSAIQPGITMCLSPQGPKPKAAHTTPVVAVDRVKGATVLGEQFIITGNDTVSARAKRLVGQLRPYH